MLESEKVKRKGMGYNAVKNVTAKAVSMKSVVPKNYYSCFCFGFIGDSLEETLSFSQCTEA